MPHLSQPVPTRSAVRDASHPVVSAALWHRLLSWRAPRLAMPISSYINIGIPVLRAMAVISHMLSGRLGEVQHHPAWICSAWAAGPRAGIRVRSYSLHGGAGRLFLARAPQPDLSGAGAAGRGRLCQPYGSGAAGS